MKYIRKKRIKILNLKQFSKESEKNFPSKKNTILITIDDGWKDFVVISPFLRRKKIPVTLFLYPDVIGYKDFFSIEDLYSLNKIRTIDFGCHSFTHKLFINIDQKTLKTEIIESRHVLENILKTDISAFAYPHGKADTRARDMVSKNYKLAFRINPMPNNSKSDRYNLNRFTIFKNTSFGEFINIIDQLSENQRKKVYDLIIPKERIDPEYKIKYTPFKIFKYPVEDKSKSILIIPSSSLGPGWVSKTVKALIKKDIETFMLVTRNNDIQFYRPDKALGVLKNWGLNEFTADIRGALKLLTRKKKKISIVTWGDGFDMVISALSGGSEEFKGLINGIITINPSILDNGISNEKYGKGVDYYNGLLNKGIYSTIKSSDFLKLKTLSDMMILKSKSLSPFSKSLGYGNLSNRETLKKFMEDIDHPILSFNFDSKEYSLKDLINIYMQPVPLFNMAVPTALIRDIHVFRAKIIKAKNETPVFDKMEFPVTFLYTDEFHKNIKNIMPLLNKKIDVHESKLDRMSTIEIILSDRLPKIILETVSK